MGQAFDEDEIPRRVLSVQLDERRKGDRLRWLDDVRNDDAKLFGLRDWRAMASDWHRWRRVLEEGKTQQ